MRSSPLLPCSRLLFYALTIVFICILCPRHAASQQTRDRQVTREQPDAPQDRNFPDPNLTEAQKEQILAEASRINKEAFRLFERGEYDAAIALAQRVLVMRVKALGYDHRMIAISWSNLALIYHKKGDDVESEKALRNAMVAYKKGLALTQDAGAGQYKAKLLSDIAFLYSSLDQYQTALDYFTFALLTYRKINDREGDAMTVKRIEAVRAQVRATTAQPSVVAQIKPELVMQMGHTLSPRVAFSPDGRLLATGAQDNVKLWEVSTGRVLRTLNGAQDTVVFSRDGRFLVTGDLRGLVTLWDVVTGNGNEMRSIPYEGTYPVFAAAISPDGKLLVTGHGDGAVSEWDTATKMEIGTTGMHGAERQDDGHIQAEAKEGEGLVMGGAGGLSVEGRTVRAIAISPDGGSYATCGDDKAIKMWDTASGQLLRTLTGHNAYVWDVAYSPDGQLLASSGGIGDLTVRLWEVSTGRLLRVINAGTQNIVSSVAFSPDGRLVAAGSFDMVRLWEAATGREVRSLSGAYGDVAFSPDGRLVATGGGFDKGETTVLWDVATGRKVRTLGGVTDNVGAVAFSQDGRWLATEAGGSVVLWELGTGRPPFRLIGNSTEEKADNVVFSPDGRNLAVRVSQGKVKVWSLATRSELYSVKGSPGQDKSDNWIHGFTFSPDGRLLATGESDGTVKLWNAESGNAPRTILIPPPKKKEERTAAPQGEAKKSRINEILDDIEKILPGVAVEILTFSPDGRMLASVNSENEVKVQDVATGRVLQAFIAYRQNFKGGVGALTFSPDNRLVTTGDIGGSIKFWDVVTGRELGHISEPKPINIAHSVLSDLDSQLSHLVYRPDGKYLAALGKGDTVKVWDVSTGRKMFTIAGRAGLSDLDWSRDGRFIATSSFDGTTRLWDGLTGEALAALVTFSDGNNWLVVAPDGLFDGAPEGWNKILWRFTPKTFDVQPVEAFFSEFYYPGLLDELVQGKKPKAAKNILQKDRRQPDVKVTPADGVVVGNAGLNSRSVKLKIELTEALVDATHASGSGVRDLRLFRNGSLVKLWKGDGFAPSEKDDCKLQARATPKSPRSSICTVTVPVVAGPNTFRAYAFNGDNVKSEDATLGVNGADNIRRAGMVYVLAVGVNDYENNAFTLTYAVSDAEAFGAELKREQDKLKVYERTEIVPLYNEQATREKIVGALKELASKVKPEDAVVVYFAGHGTVGSCLSATTRQVNAKDRFYLVPHDLGYKGGIPYRCEQRMLDEVVRHSISDLDLEAAFEKIDAGQILLVIDACNSGQALESEEKRRGPMNSKGLAQLAYEKGMYILTAAQSFQEAKADKKVAKGHGYLTYALVEEALKTKVAADRDGNVTLRQWVDYAVQRVPRMQHAEAAEQRRFVKKQADKVAKDEQEVQTPRVFYRREPDIEPFVVARP